jgi:phosphohistidine phosphatase
VAQRRLVLIRHAKSADGPIDIERPLAPRGRRDAPAIGRFLHDASIVPDLVVVSPATRAGQTWKAVRRALPEVRASVDERIYDNTVEALLAVVHGTDAEVRTLGLVGHNPSFEELAGALDDGSGDTDARRRMHEKFPTSAVAVFAVPTAWADVQPATATLTAFEVPRSR